MKSLFFLLLMALLVSCSETTLNQGGTFRRDSQLVRGKCLENGSIQPIYLDYWESGIYRPLDTVWVNTSTGRIDNTDSTAMKYVLYLP